MVLRYRHLPDSQPPNFGLGQLQSLVDSLMEYLLWALHLSWWVGDS